VNGANGHSAIALNDGNVMPRLGLGLMRRHGKDMTNAVIRRAFDTGYRLFDTASVYGTEPQTGDAIRSLGVDRRETFVTSKLWNADQGADKARAALEGSLERLGLDQLDLYLVHWPCPALGLYVETWRALIELKQAGLVRSIGVSNFQIAHLEELIEKTQVVPAVNQIEVHPYFQQRQLHEFHRRHGIVTQAWSPFGGGGTGTIGALFDDPLILEIAQKHGRSPAQVVLGWHLAMGMSAIPKATSERHLGDNYDSLALQLDTNDLAAIAKLDRPDGRVGADPDTMHYQARRREE